MERSGLVSVGRGFFLSALPICCATFLEAKSASDIDGVSRTLVALVGATPSLLVCARAGIQQLSSYSRADPRMGVETGGIQSTASLAGISSGYRFGPAVLLKGGYNAARTPIIKAPLTTVCSSDAVRAHIVADGNLLPFGLRR